MLLWPALWVKPLEVKRWLNKDLGPALTISHQELSQGEEDESANNLVGSERFYYIETVLRHTSEIEFLLFLLFIVVVMFSLFKKEKIKFKLNGII